MAATWVNIVDLFWPIGSVYYRDHYEVNGSTTDPNSPSVLFGGTWVKTIVTDPDGDNETYKLDRYVRTA